MRDVLVGLAALAALVLIAVAPSWERTHGKAATTQTSSPRSTPLPTPTATPISAPYDTSRAISVGPGHAVCGASDTWQRPTLQQQQARLASDPRYRDVRFDDGSAAARTFRSEAVLYDGSGQSSRQGLVAFTGLWSDPDIGRSGCATMEQQVWLLGYAPDRYEVFDGASAVLEVHRAAGYRMVVITGEPRHALVVFGDGMKLELLNMDMTRPVRVGTPPPSLPASATPGDLVLFPSCAITPTRIASDAGQAWFAHCGAGKVHLALPGEAARQGWTLIRTDGPYGAHIFRKGDLWMQMSFGDGPRGIEDPVAIVQTYRALVTPAPRPTP